MVASKHESFGREPLALRPAPVVARIAITSSLLALAFLLHDRAGQLERRERLLGEMAGRLARDARPSPQVVRPDRAASRDRAVESAGLLVGRHADGRDGHGD